MKVIKSLENRRILLEWTTRKISSQEGGFLNFLRPLMTSGLPLMKSVLTPLAKNVLLPFGLSALIISNEELNDIMKIVKNDIMKIVKSLAACGLLTKDASETIKNETKEQKGGFISMLLATLAASILGTALTGREVIRAGKGTIRAGQGTIRAGENFEYRPTL